MSDIIVAEHLTKDYGNGRGIFDINFSIKKGEMFGFVGTNGSGKTTTIRNIMGFLKPDGGNVLVNGLDSWIDACEIKKLVGYVPGEIAFPDLKSGTEFLKEQAEFLGTKDLSYANEIIEILQLDPTANPRKMSKGMKQKTAVVAAIMHNPEIIILDEPTTGLDPLMRVEFMEVMKREKARGKTIMISSHMFEELETTCDRVALIMNGHIVDIADMKKIRTRPKVEFKIEFLSEKDYLAFQKLGYKATRLQPQYNQVTIEINKKKISELMNDLTKFKVKFISEIKYTLEKYFKDFLKSQKGVKNDK